MSASLERRVRAAEIASGANAPALTDEEVLSRFAGYSHDAADVDHAFEVLELPMLAQVMGVACSLRTGRAEPHPHPLPYNFLELLAHIVAIPAALALPSHFSEYADVFEGPDPATLPRSRRGRWTNIEFVRVPEIRHALTWRLCEGTGASSLRQELDAWFADPREALLAMPGDAVMERGLVIGRALHQLGDLPLDLDWRTLVKRRPVDTAGQEWTLAVRQWCAPPT